MSAEAIDATEAPAQRTPSRVLAVAGHVRDRQRTLVAVVPVSAIRRNPDQPRKSFDPQRLAELAVSIRERGLLQPVVLRRHEDGNYLLMAGERRLRAAELAGVVTVPALVRDDDPLEVGLIENLQREDLSPLEEADALSRLVERRGYTHKTLADLLGKSRPYVSNTLSLVRLPARLREEIAASDVDVSRELLIAMARQASPEAQAALWSRIKLSHLSVRRYRESAGEPASAREASRSQAATVLRNVRRLNGALRQLEWRIVSEEDRVRLRRALTRLDRRITRVLAAVPT
jgi:ParB family chromosome partitioning protein